MARKSPMDIYSSTARRKREAKAALARAKRAFEKAGTAEAHGVAAIRFAENKDGIKKADCFEIHGDGPGARRFCHRGSFGSFVRAMVRFEEMGGHVGGYSLFNDQRDADASWRARR